jgi:hypothetical protein
MTIKQMAEVSGVSTETVSRKVKEMYPDRVTNGRPTNLIQTEAICVMTELRKKNFVEPLQNEKVPLQNDKLPIQNANVVTKSDLAAFGTAIVSEMMKQFLPLIQNRQPLMIEQDYFSINGYANKIGQRIAFSDALAIGRMAGKLSREKGTEIRKVDDERYGTVNSYHVDILKEVFSV